MLTISKAVQRQYPGLPFGIMAMENVSNPKVHEGLTLQKNSLETAIRERFAHMDRPALKARSPLMEYNAFYRQFKKTYHVQLQLESIAFKNKPLPSVAALVEAMFMSEINNQLLTAGYDFDSLSGKLHVELSTGNEHFMGIGNKEKTPPINDVLLMDADHILGSTLCGPDHACRITHKTKRVLFAVYGVQNINHAQIDAHFDDIATNVKIVSPHAGILQRIIL